MRSAPLVLGILLLASLAFAQGGFIGGGAGAAAGPPGPAGASGIAAMGCINPVDYGADPTGVADSIAAFEAARDAMDALTYRCMIIPDGAYNLSFPFWIDKAKSAVYGMGGKSFSTKLLNMVLVADRSSYSSANAGLGAGVLWTDPLIGATGHSIASWGYNVNGPIVDLKEFGHFGSAANWDMEYNGYAAFDVQFWFTFGQGLTGFNNQTHRILTSAGNDGTAAVSYGPISIWFDTAADGSTATMKAKMNLSDGVVQANGAAFPIDSTTPRFIEISYDGSNIRIFVDGTQSGSDTPATGTTVDKPYYNMSLFSAATYPGWGATLGNIVAIGKLFGIRVSKIARNTSNYTAPVAALACDANALYLLNGTQVTASSAGTFSAYGPFYKPECINGAAPTSQAYSIQNHGLQTYAEFTVKGLNIYNPWSIDGLHVYGAAGATFADIYAQAGLRGIFLDGISYANNWSDMWGRGANAGMMFKWSNNLCTNCQMYADHYGVVSVGANDFRGMLAVPGGAGYQACYMNYGDLGADRMQGVTCDNEAYDEFSAYLSGGYWDNSSFQATTSYAGVYIANNSSITLNNINLLRLGNTPLEWVGGPTGATSLSGAQIHINGGTDPWVLPLINNTTPITLNGAHYSITDMGQVSLTGTTAGTATLGCPTFTDSAKTCIVDLAGYRNSGGTAQRMMIPVGATAFGSFTADSGDCATAAPTIATGDNTWCTASRVPYYCCTGSGTGTCTGHQFVLLPTSMGAPETGVCRVSGS